MEFLPQFFHVFIHYTEEIWWTLAIGFFLSGLFHQFIPTSFVEKHLGKKGFKSVFVSSIVGVILPVCCIGALPIAITLKRKGASLGSILAFMVATPATSISALLVCLKLLGAVFTLIIFFGVIFMGMVMGFVANGIKYNYKPQEDELRDCCHDSSQPLGVDDVPNATKLKNALKFAFITLPKEIGLEVIVGIALASFITVFEPIQHLIHEYLVGAVGYVFVLFIGLLTYVCSTASVPMADAFIQSGMSYGQALCYLLVGPITSYGTILVIKKDFGMHVLALYLSIICVLSLIYGIILDAFNLM